MSQTLFPKKKINSGWVWGQDWKEEDPCSVRLSLADQLPKIISQDRARKERQVAPRMRKGRDPDKEVPQVEP